MMLRVKSNIGRFCAICAGVFAVPATFAAAPFQTDDPEPLDAGEHEIFVSFKQTRTAAGSSGSQPAVELNYGPTADLQLGIEIPYAFDGTRHGTLKRGLGDIALSAKFRFLQETTDQPMASFFPLIALPTGDTENGIGNGKAQLFLPLWFEKNWGEWQMNGGGGYWINHASDARNHWFFGWQLQKDISQHWMVGAEIFHSTEEKVDEGASTGFNIGVTYAIDEHNHLLFSAGRGLSNVQTTNQFSSYFGYQLQW